MANSRTGRHDRASNTPLGVFGFVALVALAGVIGVAGCQQSAKVAKVGQPVEAGKMKIDVTGYEVRKLEIVEGGRTHEYQKPVLAVSVEMTNTGKDAFRYVPNHTSEQVTERTSPLLYYHPGKKKSLPPSDKSSLRISGVTLEKGQLNEQVQSATRIKPGETLGDVMLFEVPEEEQADLVFSMPPSVHRGNKPVLFRLAYQYQSPEGPTWHGIGEAAELEGVKFEVSEVSTEYVELEPPGDAEKAFSNSPILKVSYQITNESDAEVTYKPGHRTVSGRRGAALFGQDDQFARVRFSSNTSVVGQKNESTTIAPGKSLKDFSLFERPGEKLSALKFEYPASRFGRAGLVRFNLPYEYETPEKPDPLKEQDDEE